MEPQAGQPAKYWLGRHGQQHGPYSLEDLRRLIAERAAEASDLVWTEGMAAWVPLFDVIPSSAAPGAPPLPPSAPPLPVTAPPAWPPPPATGAARTYDPSPYYPAVPSPVVPGPIPPEMHWALVLLFGSLTVGVFSIAWMFHQANYVKRIDPQNKSRKLLIAIPLMWAAVFVIIAIVGVTVGMPPPDAPLDPSDSRFFGRVVVSLSGGLAFFATPTCVIMALFKMRRSLLTYYNTVEPIQLSLNGVMTFFFHIFYFQYQLSRIAEWKRTGRLRPQQV